MVLSLLPDLSLLMLWNNGPALPHPESQGFRDMMVLRLHHFLTLKCIFKF